MQEVLAKGINFVYAREFIKNEYGEERWGRVLDTLQPSDREIWRKPLLVTEQFPFSAFINPASK